MTITPEAQFVRALRSIRTSVSLRPDQVEWLSVEATRHGCTSLSGVIRELIDEARTRSVFRDDLAAVSWPLEDRGELIVAIRQYLRNVGIDPVELL